MKTKVILSLLLLVAVELLVNSVVWWSPWWLVAYACMGVLYGDIVYGTALRPILGYAVCGIIWMLLVALALTVYWRAPSKYPTLFKLLRRNIPPRQPEIYVYMSTK